MIFSPDIQVLFFRSWFRTCCSRQDFRSSKPSSETQLCDDFLRCFYMDSYMFFVMFKIFLRWRINLQCNKDKICMMLHKVPMKVMYINTIFVWVSLLHQKLVSDLTYNTQPPRWYMQFSVKAITSQWQSDHIISWSVDFKIKLCYKPLLPQLYQRCGFFFQSCNVTPRIFPPFL